MNAPDPIATVARAVNAERECREWIGQRKAWIVDALRRPHTSRVVPRFPRNVVSETETVSIAHDVLEFAKMLPPNDLPRALFDAHDRARLLDLYVEARANRDWMAHHMVGDA